MRLLGYKWQGHLGSIVTVLDSMMYNGDEILATRKLDREARQEGGAIDEKAKET